jgi:hypothetical protein
MPGEWENKFQLTETGKYPVHVGFMLEIERPEDRSEGDEYKWGPLLQSEFDPWQANLNLLIEKHEPQSQRGRARLPVAAEVPLDTSSRGGSAGFRQRGPVE